MLKNSIEYGSKFGYAPARDFASFIRTANMASKIFAVDSNANDVQTSGQTHLVLNGLHVTAGGKTDALDISADVQLTIWLAAQSYTTAHMRYVEHQGRKVFYKCIVDHTSAAANKPDEDNLRADATWKTYWVRSTQTAEQASGDYIPADSSRYYLALMQAGTDTLTLVKAGPVALDADVELVIPNFEPEMFYALGTLLINSAGFTLGTTSTSGVSTFAQLIGPVFPTGLGIDQN
jgi:hypothetical protein